MSRRALAFLAAIALVQGLAYSLVVPLWQAPDEPGHFEYARLMSDLGRVPATSDVSLPLQREIISSLAQADFWRFTRQQELVSLPASFADDPFLRRAGRQVGRQPFAYYIIPALGFRLTSDVNVQARLARYYSVVLSALTVVAAGWMAREIFAADLLLAVGVPMTLALAPMFAYAGSAVNNDSLANLASALTWLALAVVFRRDASRGRIALVVMAALLAFASKRTTLFLAPTLVAAIPLYLWAQGWRPARRTRVAFALVGIFVCVLAAGLMLWPGDRAAAWRVRPTGGMALLSQDAATSGSRVILLRDDSASIRLRAEQVLGASGLRQRSAVFSAAVRTASGQATACVGLGDERIRSESCTVAGPVWQRIAVTHSVAADTVLLYASAGVGSWDDAASRGVLAWDDLELTSGSGGVNLLVNPGAEARSSRLVDLADRAVRTSRLPPDMLRRLAEPASYDRPALARYGLYLLLTFAGFWGNFGWLQVPLKLVWYAVLALVCAVAALGWVRLAWRAVVWNAAEVTRDKATRAFLALLAIGVVAVLAQTFLPMIGREWQPQGRYLFPAMIPLVVCLLLGLGAWVPPRARHALLIAWLAALFLLNAVALVETIYPAFHPPLPGQRIF
ncbi:MAG: DUF2142 domain-containing protein [Anaerolineae bacterium]|nr:DUF2142 domain-containing protein [Anaerolineae bacterium]